MNVAMQTDKIWNTLELIYIVTRGNPSHAYMKECISIGIKALEGVTNCINTDYFLI